MYVQWKTSSHDKPLRLLGRRENGKLKIRRPQLKPNVAYCGGKRGQVSFVLGFFAGRMHSGYLFNPWLFPRISSGTKIMIEPKLLWKIFRYQNSNSCSQIPIKPKIDNIVLLYPSKLTTATPSKHTYHPTRNNI